MVKIFIYIINNKHIFEGLVIADIYRSLAKKNILNDLSRYMSFLLKNCVAVKLGQPSVKK